MEDEKMKMVMMNEELYKKYADAARTKVINKMKAKCEEGGMTMNPLQELSEVITMTIFIAEFGKLLFNSESDECEE